jgi:catechol 2,3-dioxygenase-like lactoylglutathione lyase family enzyme
VIRRTDHIGIVVQDFDAAKKFVGQVLGLTVGAETVVEPLRRRVAFFNCGGANIELIDDLDEQRRGAILGGRPAAIEHIAFEVDSLAATMADLGRLGVKFTDTGILQVETRLNAWTDPETSAGITCQLTAPALTTK